MLALAVQYLTKLISSFYKDHPNKPTTISKAINTALLMARPIFRPMTPKTKTRPTNKTSKKELSCVWFLSCFWPFHEIWVIHVLKLLAWKSCDFLTNPTTKISIYQNFYTLNFYFLSFNLNFLRSICLNCKLIYKVLVFLFSTLTRLGGFSLTTFLSNSNDFSVFLLNFPTKLGGFSLIDLFGFPLQFSY